VKEPRFLPIILDQVEGNRGNVTYWKVERLPLRSDEDDDHEIEFFSNIVSELLSSKSLLAALAAASSPAATSWE
jgi:hypothetical protein